MKFKIIVFLLLAFRQIAYSQQTLTIDNPQQLDIIYFLKAENYRQLKNYDSAIFYIQKSLLFNPNNALITYQANLYEAKNDYQTAAEKLKLVKSNHLAIYQLARIYALLNNADTSIHYLKQYLQTPYPIVKYKIIFDTAFDKIRNSQQWQRFWDTTKFDNHTNLLNEAYFHFVNKNYIEAITVCNKIIGNNSDFYPAFVLKGDILFEVKNYKEAYSNFSRAAKINRNSADIHYKLAYASQKLGNYNQAIIHYNQSLSQNPYNPDAYFNLAYCYNQTKEYNKALTAINLYLCGFTNDINALYLKIDILTNKGDLLQALKTLNSFSSENQKTPDFYFARGKIYLQTNSFDQAYYDFSQVLDLNPKFTDVYYYRGLASLKMNKIDQACNDWQTAQKNNDYRANNLINKYCSKYNR